MILLSMVCRLTSRKMSTGFITVRPILSLQVHLWMDSAASPIISVPDTFSVSPEDKTTHPILVVKYDGVRRGEVDAQPTRTRA